jgi:hypothetical protein
VRAAPRKDRRIGHRGGRRFPDCRTVSAGAYHAHLIPAKSADNDFAAAFENGLRARGFTLAPAAAANTLSVAYTLDALDEKSAWYLQLRLSDGKAVARAYSASGQPEAGQSRTEMEFQRSALGKMVGKAGQKARQTWDTGVNALTE